MNNRAPNSPSCIAWSRGILHDLSLQSIFVIVLRLALVIMFISSTTFLSSQPRFLLSCYRHFSCPEATEVYVA
jgi:hypothetical protein